MDGQAWVNRLLAVVAIAFSLTMLHLLKPVLDRERPFEDARAGFVDATVDAKETKHFTSSRSGKSHVTYTVRFAYAVAGEDYTGEATCTDCPQLAGAEQGQPLKLRYDMNAPGSTRVDGIDTGIAVVERFELGLYTLLLAGAVMLLLGRLANLKRWLRPE